jgi:hypothetical protein
MISSILILALSMLPVLTFAGGALIVCAFDSAS